jgi:hypothetical protein
VVLEKLFSLMEAQAQGVAEVVMRNPLLAIEVDEVRFLRLAAGVGPIDANPLLNTRR